MGIAVMDDQVLPCAGPAGCAPGRTAPDRHGRRGSVRKWSRPVSPIATTGDAEPTAPVPQVVVELGRPRGASFGWIATAATTLSKRSANSIERLRRRHIDTDLDHT